MVYASGILGNAVLEGELKIDHSDAKGENVILTYKLGSGMGATVLNKNLIMLNVPKDLPFKISKLFITSHPLLKNCAKEMMLNLRGALIKTQSSPHILPLNLSSVSTDFLGS